MLVFTAKLTKKKVLFGVLGICLVICSAAAGIHAATEKETENAEEQTISTETPKLKTNEDRVKLLNDYGWEVDSEPIEHMEVRIPEKFDGVYSEYNEIQKKQGMDLTDYAGKRVMRYTYKVNNHKNGEDVVANIIVYKDECIAGDICSPKLGGFMHALNENTGDPEKTQN